MLAIASVSNFNLLNNNIHAQLSDRLHSKRIEVEMCVCVCLPEEEDKTSFFPVSQCLLNIPSIRYGSFCKCNVQKMMLNTEKEENRNQIT